MKNIYLDNASTTFPKPKDEKDINNIRTINPNESVNIEFKMIENFNEDNTKKENNDSPKNDQEKPKTNLNSPKTNLNSPEKNKGA